MSSSSSPHVSFAFDIDGVVYHHTPGLGMQLIPGASEAFALLDEKRVPYVFLSNSSGSFEAEKAQQLTSMLAREITEEQVILATTPFYDLAPTYAGKRVLAVALHEATAHKLATHYGLRNYITIQEYARRHPHLVPCKAYTRASAPDLDIHPEPAIEAVFIFEVPLDWWESIQILVDLLRSSGRPGREHEAGEQRIPVFTSSADFHYGSTHSVPRLTNGAFLLCLRTVFAQATGGRSFHVEIFGKPSQAVYTCARQRLEQQQQKRREYAASPSSTHLVQVAGDSAAPTSAGGIIYMIGDNPHSDIQGALAAGEPWRAVLVRTGCFQGGDNDPEFPAHHVCQDIFAAVKLVLGQHGLL